MPHNAIHIKTSKTNFHPYLAFDFPTIFFPSKITYLLVPSLINKYEPKTIKVKTYQ